jgi:hypothetical protein
MSFPVLVLHKGAERHTVVATIKDNDGLIVDAIGNSPNSLDKKRNRFFSD